MSKEIDTFIEKTIVVSESDKLDTTTKANQEPDLEKPFQKPTLWEEVIPWFLTIACTISLISIAWFLTNNIL